MEFTVVSGGMDILNKAVLGYVQIRGFYIALGCGEIEVSDSGDITYLGPSETVYGSTVMLDSYVKYQTSEVAKPTDPSLDITKECLIGCKVDAVGYNITGVVQGLWANGLSIQEIGLYAKYLSEGEENYILLGRGVLTTPINKDITKAVSVTFSL